MRRVASAMGIERKRSLMSSSRVPAFKPSRSEMDTPEVLMRYRLSFNRCFMGATVIRVFSAFVPRVLRLCDPQRSLRYCPIYSNRQKRTHEIQRPHSLFTSLSWRWKLECGEDGTWHLARNTGCDSINFLQGTQQGTHLKAQIQMKFK
jgi:hypothetical protein